jgi:hypothetical protein
MQESGFQVKNLPCLLLAVYGRGELRNAKSHLYQQVARMKKYALHYRVAVKILVTHAVQLSQRAAVS